jgi:type IV pilus assembly protein PilM
MKLPFRLGHGSGPDVVGLDIQPGFVAAVRARVNGSIAAERAAALPLAGDVVRDGEVMDDGALSEVLRELFESADLPKRVRVGVANQRTVLRTIELPPVSESKELAAAVAFQAQDQVPMPLSNAVMDFHPLGIVDTPAGPRQRVVLVAAQRDMIERLLGAVRRAGLQPEGIDLSAFALIRSLYRHEAEQDGRVLYLNVDGLTNLAIAEGTICRFTRVVGGGLEGMATELAERRSIALAEARELLAGVDLTAAVAPAPAPVADAPYVPSEPDPDVHFAAEPDPAYAPAPDADASYESPEPAAGEPVDAPYGESEQPSAVPGDVYSDESESELSYEEMTAVEGTPAAAAASSEDLVAVLENGIRDISGEVRNSLDFHRSQDGGGEVSHIVLSGAARDIPGFATALEGSLNVEVRCQDIALAHGELSSDVSPHRLAVATGLASSEVAQ